MFYEMATTWRSPFFHPMNSQICEFLLRALLASSDPTRCWSYSMQVWFWEFLPVFGNNSNRYLRNYWLKFRLDAKFYYFTGYDVICLDNFANAVSDDKGEVRIFIFYYLNTWTFFAFWPGPLYWNRSANGDTGQKVKKLSVHERFPLLLCYLSLSCAVTPFPCLTRRPR